ncbi:hypothetical protein ACTVZO_35845 [Streptomyces sp. IBSNAI002]|uniref:hypothetical protein n=1 Tax=Streptomyces sp. IBSNAI002 TaxID=3457500 RepID=UPI003FCFDE0A
MDDRTAARHFWDARYAPELHAWCGGTADRLPFFRADGTPLGARELPGSDPGPAVRGTESGDCLAQMLERLAPGAG